MKKIFVIILLLFCCIPLIDLFHPGLPITNDGKDHVARIANFYQNLQEGILVPRWAGNLNWGYGHPILEFLYPLPSYIASLFHGIGFSLIDATKIVFGLGIVFSGLCMYLWLSEFLPIPAAFIGGILYVFTPYRFVELYVRGDIGENLAFVFIPLTLLFIYKLYKKEKDSGFTSFTRMTGAVSLIAISFACLMLSHNAIVLMYFPFIVFYCFYLVYLSKHRKFLLLTLCFSLLLGFALSAFFWVPALLEGKYTLRNIVTAGDYAKRFVSFSQLAYGPWNYDVAARFTKQLGIFNWIALVFSLLSMFLIWKKKWNYSVLIAGLIVYTAFSIFLMLPQSSFVWSKIILLQNFQFPWRFLAIPLFTLSVLAAFFIASVPKSFYKPVVFISLLVILFCNKDYWHAQGYFSRSDTFFSSIYNGTTDTGESSPIWSTRFMEHRFKQPMEIVSGKAAITQVSRTITKHDYTVSVSSSSANIRENTVYFPGWEVLVDNQLTPIQYQDAHNRGIITFSIPQGVHAVSVIYKETKLRLLSDYISLVALFGIAIVFVISIMKNNRLRYNKAKP